MNYKDVKYVYNIFTYFQVSYSNLNYGQKSFDNIQKKLTLNSFTAEILTYSWIQNTSKRWIIQLVDPIWTIWKTLFVMEKVVE